MTGKGLIIGIDYSDQYCQVCYYSLRHKRPESVTAGTDVMRYLIPSVLCFNKEQNDWMIGNSALKYSGKTGEHLFQNLMEKISEGATVRISDKDYSYRQLLAIYFRKIFEYVQIRTSVMGIRSVTLAMRKVDKETKDILEDVFKILEIQASDVKLLSYAESYAYFVLNEDMNLWRDGALLFDFSPDGFFAKQLTVSSSQGLSLVYVNEHNYSIELSTRDLASGVLRNQMDAKLLKIYEELRKGCTFKCVYFTGEGFNDLWFRETLDEISEDKRAFRGNNIYVKGACIAGCLRDKGEAQGIPIFCKGRTKADISLEARVDGKVQEIKLSGAATDWYDASVTKDFILENEKSVVINITSLVSRVKNIIEFDLSEIPSRDPKTTRIEISVKYFNDFECEITVKDKGFGEFFESSGVTLSKRLNLDGYV